MAKPERDARPSGTVAGGRLLGLLGLFRSKPLLVLFVQGSLRAVKPALSLFRVGADIPAIQTGEFGFEVGDRVVALSPGLQVQFVQANHIPRESVSGGVYVQCVVY